MKNMTLAAIAEAVSGKLHIGKDADTLKEATCVVVDSRLIEAGGIFVATKGEKVDGHTFIPQVMEKGALAAICEVAPCDDSYSYIVVEDSFVALKKIAKYYRSQLDIKLVGIIGSVGKTSTKEIVSSVLSEKYKVLKTQGNFNNEVGVPLTICRIRDEHQVAVVEMGISDFGEMKRLSDIARPDAVVMTNIGPCHLENLGDLKGVLKAKTEVFEYMKDNSLVVLNAEDENLASVSKDNLNIIMYGNGSDFYADNIQNHGLKGSSFALHVAGETVNAKITLPGIHMVTNAVAAAAIGHNLGLSACEIVKGLEKAEGIAGRSNLVETEDYLLIDDCYNANPKSMKSAIDLLMEANGRKVAILGDMFELGENECVLHGEVGEYAASKGIDLLICVGNLSKNMYESAMKVRTNTEVMYYKNKEDLLINLKDTSKSPLKKDDTVLIKASHGMGFAEIVNLLK